MCSRNENKFDPKTMKKGYILHIKINTMKQTIKKACTSGDLFILQKHKVLFHIVLATLRSYNPKYNSLNRANYLMEENKQHGDCKESENKLNSNNKVSEGRTR
jgi:hypothetical protein